MSFHKPTGFDSVTSGLKRLQEGAIPTDFILESSSGKTWNVHKAVLLMQSDVLFRMVTAENFAECQNGRVVLEDAADPCIDVLVAYMYSLTVKIDTCILYFEGVEDVEASKAETRILIGLCRLADLYNIEPVFDFAYFSIMGWFIYSDIDLIEIVLDTFAEFNTIPESLWEAVTKETAFFLHHKEQIDMERVHAMMKRIRSLRWMC
ncbi:hypothetical protein M409DRAFT_25473 [Zasmidium cellare ATCC 36951]|uniref:BTB domain-containing protein n=1 Tax=Zasmidium cellare ATCC 36951 TaxID=1080233 RepID=A0A6A6CAA3_ZASCE|nr:uncharacterized protein M409DRAFT_25473 [Zasmidium cellare ATCC 36951]KAF2164127.1 hypothetical protein M409DRAFT_25473 [Zasmidium cellare ATCC 36951]